MSLDIPVESVCTKSQLQLFNKPVVEGCIEESHILDCYPIAPLSNMGPVEFVIQKSDRYYLDLYNTCIRLAVKITMADGTATPEVNEGGAAPIPMNNFLHSMFSNCTLEIEGTQIGHTHNMYALVAYLSSVLNMSASAKRSLIATPAMYEADQVSGAAPTTTPVTISGPQNIALKKRAALVEKSKVVHLYGKPIVPFFNQPLYLLNNCEVRLTLHRNRPEYALMCLAPDPQGYRIEITSAVLEVRRMSLAESTSRAYESALASSKVATYLFPSLDCRHFEIGKGCHNHTAQNVFSNYMPQRALLMFLPTEAYLGTYKTNPLIFWHEYVSQITFLIDDKAVRARPMKMDFDPESKTGENYLDAYKSLFEFMRCTYTNNELDIIYKDYARQLCLFGLDITADQSDSSPTKRGNFSIDIRFSKPTAAALKGICVAEFPSAVMINKDRNVQFSLM